MPWKRFTASSYYKYYSSESREVPLLIASIPKRFTTSSYGKNYSSESRKEPLPIANSSESSEEPVDAMLGDEARRLR